MIASDLVLTAYYKAGILDPEETVDGYYLRRGLQNLNDIIADWSSLGSLIVFFNNITITATQNKFSYVISRLPGADYDGEPITELVQAHVVIGGVKSSLTEVFTTLNNVENYSLIQGIPSSIYLEQSEAQTEVKIYPAPSQTMPLHIQAKSRYAQITDAFVQAVQIVERARSAFTYELANRLATEFQEELTQSFLRDYTTIMDNFQLANVRDLPVNPDTGLNNTWGSTSWYGTTAVR